MPDDDFVLVKSKKKKRPNKKASSVVSRAYYESSVVSCSINKESLLRRVDSAKQDISESDFFSSLLTVLQQGLELVGGDTSVKQLICYGLGNFSECMSARFQLGLLLLLKDRWKTHALLHDPVFSNLECECLGILGCELITKNEEGKHIITYQVNTLIYLPHCPKQLINNFLWANWGENLNNCIILTNSFSKIVESHPQRILAKDAGYIFNIVPYTEELGIVNCFKYTDIFNDTSLHVFPLKKRLLHQHLWDFKDEPVYHENDIEFITRKFVPALKIEQPKSKQAC